VRRTGGTRVRGAVGITVGVVGLRGGGRRALEAAVVPLTQAVQALLLARAALSAAEPAPSVAVSAQSRAGRPLARRR
jgi:hypothetical protein